MESAKNQSSIDEAFNLETFHIVDLLRRLRYYCPHQKAAVENALYRYAWCINQLVKQFDGSQQILGEPCRSESTRYPSLISSQAQENPDMSQLSDCFLTPMNIMRPGTHDEMDPVLREHSQHTMPPWLDASNIYENTPSRDVSGSVDFGTMSSHAEGFQNDIGGIGESIDPLMLSIDTTCPLRAELFVDIQQNPRSLQSLSAPPIGNLEESGTLSAITGSSRQYASNRPDLVRKRKRSQSRSHKENRRQVSETSEIQYAELRCNFARSLENHDHDQLSNMCIFYSAIAGSESMIQLKDIIISWLRTDDWRAACELATVYSTVRMLDKLESATQSAALFRRILLLRLARHREILIEKPQNQNHSNSGEGLSLLGGKPESRVIDELTVQAYPHITKQSEEKSIQEWRLKHEGQRKALQNRLNAARNWKQAVQNFGLGIIALVPTGGTSGVQNQSFEQLRTGPCRILLQFLQQKDDGCVVQAAKQLTPFMQALYDGKSQLPRLELESCTDLISEEITPSKVVELCREISHTDEESELSPVEQRMRIMM